MARPRRQPHRPDSRARLLTAASVEFARHGYAGASVDRISARARLNKGMLYYHFGSKAGIYREILRDVFRTLGEGARAVAERPGSPEQRLRGFVEVLAREIGRRPHFPHIMMREMAEQGLHLDAETLRLLLVVPRTFGEIVAQGVAAGAFRPVDPLLAYLSVLGPVVIFTASASMRAEAMKKIGPVFTEPGHDDLVTHVQAVALGMLRGSVGAAPLGTMLETTDGT